MFPPPSSGLRPNTAAFECQPQIKPSGFREYDARWLFPTEINLVGVQALGSGLGTLLRELGTKPEIVTGHDFRSYSGAVKLALTTGLMAAGFKVYDIGLALTPMAYFAQFELGGSAVAMVTASHNENGWTGFKMGACPPLTFGPESMSRLKEIVFTGRFHAAGGGSYEFHPEILERYVADLTSRPKLKHRHRAVVACGNGTAGAFAPRILEAIGVDVIPLDTDLDYTFPAYNPNPEDLKMLQAISDAVLKSGAAIGLGFDGDGDRCGVVDNQGKALFADKVGLLLARDLSVSHHAARFVVDIKSTGLFANDPVLRTNRASVEYWKTGHSYMKRRIAEVSALAGFEKSGHYFFNPPLGRGYDDALVSALAILDMLDRSPDRTLADIAKTLPETWSSPTMAAHCPDEKKYTVGEGITAHLLDMQHRGEALSGKLITDVNTLNGVRVTVEDGTWGLVRPSSNKPELVVVVESPVSEQRMSGMFRALDHVIRRSSEIGEYNQTIQMSS